ncbi:hypothetical protein OQA88_5522 [Cercophora sp. LCS_1]
MYWTFLLWLAALFLREAVADKEGVFQDRDTGLTFYQTYQPYKLDNGRGMWFRIAIPSPQPSGAFDIVTQLIVPNEVGWAGVSWGGGMAESPLLVVFRNANNQGVLASSRWSNGHTAPNAYSSATYTVYKAGTKINGTHWQVTMKCTGCTSWSRRDGSKPSIKPAGGHRLGWAYSTKKPTSPNSATAAISVHDNAMYFELDFSKGGNANFASIVGKLQ